MVMTGKAAPLQQLAPEGPQRAVNGRIHGAGFEGPMALGPGWHLDGQRWESCEASKSMDFLYQSMSS
jgi:hypothetical protein